MYFWQTFIGLPTFLVVSQFLGTLIFKAKRDKVVKRLKYLLLWVTPTPGMRPKKLFNLCFNASFNVGEIDPKTLKLELKTQSSITLEAIHE